MARIKIVLCEHILPECFALHTLIISYKTIHNDLQIAYL